MSLMTHVYQAESDHECGVGVQFIREVYWEFEYEEVVTPNIYNFDLWKTSGHADHYKQNMFSFDIEKQEFGLKPMNCPGQSQACLGFLALTRKSSAHQRMQKKVVQSTTLFYEEGSINYGSIPYGII